jgi:hypothetical protein
MLRLTLRLAIFSSAVWCSAQVLASPLDQFVEPAANLGPAAVDVTKIIGQANGVLTKAQITQVESIGTKLDLAGTAVSILTAIPAAQQRQREYNLTPASAYLQQGAITGSGIAMTWGSRLLVGAATVGTAGAVVSTGLALGTAYDAWVVPKAIESGIDYYNETKQLQATQKINAQLTARVNAEQALKLDQPDTKQNLRAANPLGGTVGATSAAGDNAKAFAPTPSNSANVNLGTTKIEASALQIKHVTLVPNEVTSPISSGAGATATKYQPQSSTSASTSTASAPKVTVVTPAPKVTMPAVHAPTPTVQTPTVRTPTVTARVPTPTVHVPTPTVHIPTPTIHVPTVTVRVPTVSDARLKRDIVALGELPNGLHLYRYRYLWSDRLYVGVMAQEVLAVAPDAVVRGNDGYLRVDYARLGLRLTTWDQWISRRSISNR